MLGYKASLNVFQSSEVIESMFSAHGGIRLEIRRKTKDNCKIHIHLEITKYPSEKMMEWQQKREIIMESRKYLEMDDNTMDIPKFV